MVDKIVTIGTVIIGLVVLSGAVNCFLTCWFTKLFDGPDP